MIFSGARNTFSRFFSLKPDNNNLPEDQVLAHTFALIIHPPHLLLEKYRTYTRLSEKDRRLEFLKLYVEIEEFILSNKPPLLKNEYTHKTLHDELATHIKFSNLSPESKVIFMSEAEQRLYVYQLCIQQIITILSQNIELNRIKEIVKPLVENTILSDISITDKGVDFRNLIINLQSAQLNVTIHAFKKTYTRLYEEIFVILGEKQAIDVVHSTFIFLQKNYKYTVTAYLFDIIPEGILENERLSFMSRETLEKQILQRTAELVETKKHLEEKVALRTSELAQEKSKVETILRSIGDAVFAVDLDCKIILMNKIAEDLSGFKLSDAIGKYYSEIFRFTFEDEPQIPYGPFVENIIKSGLKGELSTKAVIVKKDGTKIPIADSAAPIFDQSDKIRGCVVVFRDASRDRELERAKDTFISIAAHQLRTPLGSIRWNIEMLLDDTGEILSPSVRKTIEHIYENDKRLITLVNDLLNVSRIEQKKIPYDATSIDIIQIIKDTINELEIQAKKKNEQLLLDSAGKEKIILTVDKKRFREIIENLISNAIKYNKEGKNVDIKISIVKENVIITVADQGIGIPDKDKNNIFSKFFRAENALKSETEGTGLGLFVVQSFVENLGGSLWFESRENEGTTFYIKLPLK